MPLPYTRDSGDTAVVDFVFCAITPTRCPESGTEAWVYGQLVVLALGVLLPVWALLSLATNVILGLLGSYNYRDWRAVITVGPRRTRPS
jgi:hypothetical protein